MKIGSKMMQSKLFGSILWMIAFGFSGRLSKSGLLHSNYVAALPLETYLPTDRFKAFILAIQANIYGYPLLEGMRLANTITKVNCTSLDGYAPMNVIAYKDDSDILTAAPNTDVLYAPSVLNLINGPVVIQHPDMGTRYFSFQLTDPYTNVIGYLGSRTTGREAARFAIKWKHDNTTGHTHLTNINKTIIVDYAGISILGRVLVNDPDEDYESGEKLLKQFEIIPPGGRVVFPKCDPNMTFKQYSIPSGLKFYEELSNALDMFPPPVQDEKMLKALLPIGVGSTFSSKNSKRSATNDYPLKLSKKAKKALVRANLIFKPTLMRILEQFYESNSKKYKGWTQTPENLGNFGTDYLIRAATAIVGYGANSPDEAYYQSAYYDNKGSPLHSNSTYQLVFPPGMEPPANEFWSLTLYKLDYTTPKNILEPIHSIGSAKKSFVRQSDGTVTIHISRNKPVGATTSPKTVNWIPSQLSPDKFYIMLRCYHPKKAVLDRTWQSPGIEKLT